MTRDALPAGFQVGKTERPTEPRFPLWGKLAFTAFVAVLVPTYWYHYTPANFLYFCDVALFLTLLGLWTEQPVFASMGAVGIVLPQSLWIIDFLVRATTGGHVVDLTEYMFDPQLSLYLRGLSFFHFWLPLMLLWMVRQQGYDRRALRYQTMVMVVVLAVSYLLVDSPTGPAGNVNKVFGPGEGTEPISTQAAWLRPLLTYRYLWVGTLMLIHATAILLPSHLILRLAFRKRTS